MLVQKENIKPFSSEWSDGSVKVWEYGGLNDQMDIGVAQIRGNYPGEGQWARNKSVETMSYLVLAGSGRIRFADGEEFLLNEGSCAFISKGRGYQVEAGEGGLKVLMASNPAWSPDQYEVYRK